MNNNFYNFNPNPFFRSVPNTGFNPGVMNSARMVPRAIGLPRISSLFSGGRNGSMMTGAASNAIRTAGTSKLTFSSILTGANKTLNVINQAIPVYNQVRPIWKNARTMFRVVKEMNTNDTNSINTSNINSKPNNYKETNNNNDNNNIIDATIEEKKVKKESNSPTFFI